MKHLFLCSIFIASFVFTAVIISCGADSTAGFTVYAVKGAIDGGTVTLYSLDETGSRSATLGTATSTAGIATLTFVTSSTQTRRWGKRNG